jgi:hypothetical protein
MALPPEFNDIEHFQSVCRSVVNRQIRETFSDLGNETWIPDIGTSRGSLRVACEHKDSDPLTLSVGRLLLYDSVIKNPALLALRGDGGSTDEYKLDTSKFPEIYLFFAQDSSAVPEGKSVIKAEYTVPWLDETLSSVSRFEATTLANKIARLFAPSGSLYTFTKGKHIVSYVDKAFGHYLQIYATNELEGEGVIKKILDIQDITYDLKKQNLHSPKRDSENNPVGTEDVYDKRIPKKRWRPTANVRFRYAKLKFQNKIPAQMLVDSTGHFHDALVKL